MTVASDLADEYRKKIKGGEIAHGERLPIERELADLHGVARSTISRFVKILKAEGLVYTTYAGTYAGPQPADPRLHRAPGPTVIECSNKPWCNNIIELHSVINLPALFKQVGWIWRGTQRGRVYYCHQCVPGVLKREAGSA